MEIRILKIVPKAFATNFNLPGKEFPTIGALAPEMPDGFVQLLLPRSRQEAGGVQARHRRSTCSPSRARSPSASIPTTPRRARAAPIKDPMAPVYTLRPWKNGSNMDINELQEGTTHLHPDLPQGRPRLDGRLALPPGQRRGEPHRARVLVPRDRACSSSCART